MLLVVFYIALTIICFAAITAYLQERRYERWRSDWLRPKPDEDVWAYWRRMHPPRHFTDPS